MELYEETFKEKKDNKKTSKIILILIGVLILITIGIVVLILYMKQSTFVVTLNNQSNSGIKNILVIDETNPSKVYVPIREIAGFLGYESFNGDYTNKSEDISKCYIQNENEIATFSLNSEKIYKLEIGPSSEDAEYEYFYTKEPVKAINGVLYTTLEGVEKAFNVDIQYDVNGNRMDIYTLDYLINFYTTKVLDYGYVAMSEDFTNKKAVLDDMLVVQKEDEISAVIKASTGDVIIGAKYEEIKYLQYASSFLVKSNSKVGIISKNRETKVELLYDSIELMDSDSNLYLVSKGDKQGVVDINGNIKIHLEYDQIGIDAKDFEQNDIKSGYLLADVLIPAQRDSLWGFFDKTGKQVTEIQYTGVGCVASSSKNVNNLIVIPEYDVVVVEKDDKYTVITAQGQEAFPCVLDDIYMIITSGNKEYYMTYQDQSIEVLSYLDRLGIGPKNKTVNTQTTEEQEESEPIQVVTE